MRAAQKRSRGLWRCQMLRSPTWGPSGVDWGEGWLVVGVLLAGGEGEVEVYEADYVACWSFQGFS